MTDLGTSDHEQANRSAGFFHLIAKLHKLRFPILDVDGVEDDQPGCFVETGNNFG